MVQVPVVEEVFHVEGVEVLRQVAGLLVAVEVAQDESECLVSAPEVSSIPPEKL